jgi:hypothetical protein
VALNFQVIQKCTLEPFLSFWGIRAVGRKNVFTLAQRFHLAVGNPYTRVMAKAAHPHPDKLFLYEKLVSTNAGTELKGATVPYTSMNGNMSSYLSKEGKLALRLPHEEIEAFLKKYKARLCQAYGIVQKEYVEVPDELLAKTSELKKYFAVSVEYVSSLKAKPAKRKAK